MKKVLIISPHFPPINAADMHRVRHNLLYLKEFGWEPTVLCVDEKYVEGFLDYALLESIPQDIDIIKVKALSTRITRKFGLGSLSLRSLVYFFYKGNQILKNKKFDLVFFSTTAFHVMVLGRYWKWRFHTPYILDFQDPWCNDAYFRVPKKERPPKFMFAYLIDKYMEACAIKRVDGIIAVSDGYYNILSARYRNIHREIYATIPFGGEQNDFKIAGKLSGVQKKMNAEKINLVYIGRGGHDLAFAINVLFLAIQNGLKNHPALFEKITMSFIGTSYAPKGKGQKTIEPLAHTYGLGHYITEVPDRLPYFDTLNALKQADILIVPGSNDNNYTASKIFPYIMAQRPLLAIFHEDSSVVSILRQTNAGEVVCFNQKSDMTNLSHETEKKLTRLLDNERGAPATNWEAFEPYTAKEMTKKQICFFEQISAKKHLK